MIELRILLIGVVEDPEIQFHADGMIIIRRDPAVSDDVAPQTAMNDDLLAIAAKPGRHRSHQATTVAEAVARRLPVDVPRIETERAVIPMPTAAERWPDKSSAVSALEFLAAHSVRRWCVSLRWALFPATA